MVGVIQEQGDDNQMKLLALKYCQDCGKKRSFMGRLFATDDELCEECYYSFIKSIRERYDR